MGDEGNCLTCPVERILFLFPVSNDRISKIHKRMVPLELLVLVLRHVGLHVTLDAK